MAVHWVTSPDELPAGATGPCVLIVAIDGDAETQRRRRRALALAMAEKCFGFTSGSLTIGKTESGALRFFDKNGGQAPLYLSHASRGGHSAVAVSPQPVGIDLETIGAPFEPAWNILHPAEQAHLRRLPDERRYLEFLRIWTAKEACLKLLGQGLNMEPATLEWRGNTLLAHLTQQSFALSEFHLDGHYICTLAEAFAA